MFRFTYFLQIALILVLILTGCASPLVVRDNTSRDGTTTALSNHRTTLFFLVDGLSLPILREHWRTDPNGSLRKYFGPEENQIHLGRTVFPTLTFPAITSLLTRSPVDHHPIIGNEILYPEAVDFAQPSGLKPLNRILLGKTIFSTLAKNGLQSASLSYSFHESATITLQANLFTGFQYALQGYESLDEQTLDTLNQLLEDQDSSPLPELIFVHLIGIDAMAHRAGPYSPELAQTLKELDSHFTKTFSILRKLEASGTPLNVILSADHGFTEIRKFVDFSAISPPLPPETKVVNQSRYVALHFSKKSHIQAQIEVFEGLARTQEIEVIAHRINDDLIIRSTDPVTRSSEQVSLHYVRAACKEFSFAISLTKKDSSGRLIRSPAVCPRDLESSLFADLAIYFHSPTHPQMIAVAGPHISLSVSDKDERKGDHGGLTAEERYIPVLLKNVQLAHPEQVVPIYQLLDVVEVK